MKLLRYGPKGQEKPGLLDKDGQIRDLSGIVKDIDGKVLADLSAIRAAKVENLPVVDKSVRLAQPVANVGKFLCIGVQRALDAGAEAIHLEEPEFWDRAGLPVSNLPEKNVMSAEDCVDAALAAFDEKELVTIPALPDVEVWNRYEQSRLALYPFLSSKEAAKRYNVKR